MKDVIKVCVDLSQNTLSLIFGLSGMLLLFGLVTYFQAFMMLFAGFVFVTIVSIFTYFSIKKEKK